MPARRGRSVLITRRHTARTTAPPSTTPAEMMATYWRGNARSNACRRSPTSGEPSTTATAASHASTLRPCATRAVTSATGVTPRVLFFQELDLAGVVDVVRGDAGDETQP